EIRRFLRDDGLIKVSRSLKQAAQKGIKAREELKNTLGREPTIKEISENTGLSCEDLVCAFDAAREPESINRALYDDSDETLSDSLSSGNDEEIITDRILIEQLLEKVEPKERQVIVLRYFKDKSQQEIAKMLGISQVQVSRIEKKVLEKMRLAKV
ncbi:MAG: sigma-70 family RNA polymerase sigma factor, partial [Clostridia bacterium]|nr:sigma-70 family RNA polymerase sigma factor [Clostridia bacterium]